MGMKINVVFLKQIIKNQIFLNFNHYLNQIHPDYGLKWPLSY